MRGSRLRAWLQKHGGALVPLFDTDGGVVRTRQVGQKTLLCRHPRMESEVQGVVRAGLKDPAWTGMLYAMGWGADIDTLNPFITTARPRGPGQRSGRSTR